MNRPWFLALSLLLAPAAAPAGEVIRYSIQLSGNPAGSASTTLVSEGERLYHYEYNDRGRGPAVDQRVVVGERGIPRLYEIKGLDYWKKPVEERFETRDGRSTWRSPVEKGEAAAGAPRVYLSLNGALQEVEVLARALLAADRSELDLLPSGRARLARLASAEVESQGRRQTVHLYSLAGLGFSPGYLWLDERQNLFALDQGWLKMIREGFEASLPAVAAAQEAQQKAWEAGLAKLARRPAGALVFQNARLFDPETRATLPGRTVVISGNRIAAVGKDGEVPVPAGAEVIRAGGKTLMPGLWDMHAHIGALDGALNLAAGVTTVRDLANDTGELLELRRRFDSGEAIGPRVVLAGFIDGPGPYAGPSKVLVDTVEEAVAAVDRYASLGYQQIKMYSSLDTRLVPPIIERAHAKGLRVSGHIPNGMTAEQAVRAGFDEINHANFLFLNFLEGVDTRTPARFHEVGEHAAELDLNSEPVRRFFGLLKERGIESDPTLNIFESMFVDRPGEIGRAFVPVADRLPPQVQRGLRAGGMTPEGQEERYRQSFEALKRMVRALYDNGVPIVAGTDALPGFSLHRELEIYVEAGIPAREALRIATLGAAEAMSRGKDLGSIAPGKLADVILVDGDPATRIGDIRRVVLTVKDGVVFDPAKIYPAISIQPMR